MMIPIIAMGLGFMILERIFPDQALPKVPGWWLRVLLVNVVQAAMVILAGLSWDHWLQRASVFDLGSGMSPLLGGFLGYIVITFVYYWWHRWRHEVNFLWLLCHQFHHSPSRIETITSFYKHPVELFINSIISGAISYTLLGLTIEGAAWVTFFSAMGEFFYHVNVKTPHWVGYFFQRPEMHRIHHERGRHWHNFADLPVWDMMFGTYKNPKTYQGPCGFQLDRELRVKDILLFRNVNNPYSPGFKEKLRFNKAGRAAPSV